MEEVVERIMWMSVSDFDLVGNIIYFYSSSFFAFICLLPINSLCLIL